MDKRAWSLRRVGAWLRWDCGGGGSWPMISQCYDLREWLGPSIAQTALLVGLVWLDCEAPTGYLLDWAKRTG